MKTGRNTPTEEARQQAAKNAETKSMMDCVKQGCCRRVTASGSPTVLRNDVEERFRAKFGRNTPAFEARTRATLSQTSVTPLTVRGDNGAEERFRMKFGRNTPAEEERMAAARHADTQQVLLASAQVATCDHDCCKREN
jgi:hypothetical protein